MTNFDNAFSHDPIEHLEDDRLGRSDFSRLLAKALAESPERRSMVVALYGDWGSGKTSTLNLCFQALKELPSGERPLVVRFNPWWYSNTGELLSQFFEELGGSLEEQAEREDVGPLKDIKRSLVAYRRLIAPSGAVADLFVSGGALTVLANLGQALAEQAAQRQQEGSQDVHTVRVDIEEALTASDRRVVIVIDDVDRLSASEIRDVFKMVKATADFPNTCYLLAFDFGTVTRALSDVQLTDGVAYLEKIVQVPFRLPDPAPGQIMDIVKESVDEIASQQEAVSEQERKKTQERLDDLAFYGLGGVWDNMRKANRFLDSLRLTLSTVAGEVRLSDFVFLEALRVTEPRVYERIIDLQYLLLGAPPGGQTWFSRSGAPNPQEQANKATSAAVEAICGATEREELKDIIEHLLEELFPRVESVKRGFGAYGPDSLDRWAYEKRVCVEDFFRVATGWGMPTGMISGSETEGLVTITDPDALRERLRLYDNDIRPGVDYEAALRRIGPFYRSEADGPALNAILRVMFSEERTDRAHPTMYLLADDALKQLPDATTRKQVLLESIEVYQVLPVTVEVLRNLGLEHGWHSHTALPENDRTLPPMDLQEVLGAVVENIKKQA